jgi:hypothetical protein
MTTLQIQVVQVCSGGEHARAEVSLNGAAPQIFHVGVEDLRGPISDEIRDTTIVGCMRLAVLGMTSAQARQKLQTGFTVTF